jgi:hypothetical protein
MQGSNLGRESSNRSPRLASVFVCVLAAFGCGSSGVGASGDRATGNAGGAEDAGSPSDDGAASDLSSLLKFDDVRTASANPNWLTDPRILTEKAGVTAQDMVGSWAWATGQTAVAFVDASGNITGTKGNGAYVVFDFFGSGAYRVRIFTVMQTGACESMAKEVQVGTFKVSGQAVQLEGVYDRAMASICGGAWTTSDYPPKNLTYQVTAAQLVDGFGGARATGGALHGPCAGLDTCYSGYADTSIPSSPGYNLQTP